MNYTNRTGLSDSIASAVKAFAQDYDKVGDYSVTTLIDSQFASNSSAIIIA